MKSTKKKEKGTISKSKDEERVPTGIENFDSLIQGGFEKNSTNLIVGSPGCGKTIFAAQFIMGGLLRGERCLYVTFEEKKKQFYDNMLEFGWDLAQYEKEGSLTFIEYTPTKVKTMLEEGGGEIENIIISKKITRMVIDSITSFELLFDNELTKREATLSLFSLISSWNCTCLLTYEEEPLKEGESPSARALEFETDSIINIYYVRTNENRERFLEIIKMRGTEHSRSIHEVNITKKGIVISKSPSKTSLIKQK